jgi:hypothetical protein
MSAVQLASAGIEPLVMHLYRDPRAVLRVVRHGVEYFRDARAVSGLRSSMAVDDVSALQGAVPARGLVRGERTRLSDAIQGRLQAALVTSPIAIALAGHADWNSIEP